ncbi:hypothetical protein ACIBBG_10355 [Micromonospora chersina]|uniref:hypothetical protein n=1 Tax=Micromonospora chersina TaxID=47854 RepID=UPI003798335A
MSTQLWRTRELMRVLTLKRIRTQVRKEELIRVRRGVYAPVPCDDEEELRALLLCLPDGAMLAMQTAARRHGFGVLRESAVHVQLPPDIAKPRLPGLFVHQSVLPVRPVTVGGLPCVPAAQCAVDLARGCPPYGRHAGAGRRTPLGCGYGGRSHGGAAAAPGLARRAAGTGTRASG